MARGVAANRASSVATGGAWATGSVVASQVAWASAPGADTRLRRPAVSASRTRNSGAMPIPLPSRASARAAAWLWKICCRGHRARPLRDPADPRSVVKTPDDLDTVAGALDRGELLLPGAVGE